MADETNNTNENQGAEKRVYTADEVKAMLEQETLGLRKKVEELLGESKSAKQKARELEEQRQRDEEERLRQANEFKTLYEREQEAKRELQEKYTAYQQRIQRQEIENASRALASELTRDAARAELLQKEIGQFARYSEDGVDFEIGGVKVDKSKILDIIRDKYPFLVDGSGASGGGAAGSGSRAPGEKIIHRADFDALDQAKRLAFVKSGGRVVD